MKSKAPVKHRTAMTEAQMPVFLLSLDQYAGAELTKLAIQVTLLTVVRTKEMRFAEWSEFGDDGVWRIPGPRMKMSRDHIVPLSPQAGNVAARIREIQKDRRLLFAAPTRSGVLSENTMLFAVQDMTSLPATVHGFRRTFLTWANEREENPDVVERCLAHVAKGVRAVYNAAAMLPQRAGLMRRWADWLDEQKDVAHLIG